MGNKSSSFEEPRQSPTTTQSSSSSWNYYDNSQAPSSQGSQSYDYPPLHRPVVPAYGPPQATYTPPQAGYSVPHPAPQDYSQGNSGHAPAPKKTLDKRYSRIADNYRSLEEVTEALGRAGLESSNLIVGIDFTKSNEWTGKKSFSGKSLHHIGNGLNPYEQGISIIGRTLAAFDEDNLIPCFGFGDASTHDQDIFSFYPDERYCQGFEEVLRRYREIVPHLKLAGPTSFAPVIEMAMTIVEQSGGQYHVLVIIADGQVTRSVDTEYGQLSPQEQRTVDAIVAASKLPLSIVLVGVGDGPWDMMKEFDDNLPAREFDNFQFVNFSEIMSKDLPQSRKETEFALAALMEVPSQYKATIELNLLGGRKEKAPGRVPLPPPVFGNLSLSAPEPSYQSSTSFQQSPSSYYEYGTSHVDNVPSAPNVAAYENQLCPICLTNPKDMAFGCGHQTCRNCGNELQLCPICRSSIQTRIKLY
ncbi:calcium-binding protein [Lithospermum erythrorhizon]|uniref:Calcium-binding protein n=1 Tax=Lithospermum erythrorhizon TaxID=34254 RepID=A0AAV3QHH8_LITER